METGAAHLQGLGTHPEPPGTWLPAKVPLCPAPTLLWDTHCVFLKCYEKNTNMSFI